MFTVVTCFQFLEAYSSMKTHASGRADSFLWYDNSKCYWLGCRGVGECAATPNVSHPKFHPYKVLRVCVYMCGAVNVYKLFSCMWGHDCVCVCVCVWQCLSAADVEFVSPDSTKCSLAACVKWTHTQTNTHNLAFLELGHMPVACVSLWLV